MRCRAYAVVPDERGERVLLRRGDGGWELPSHDLEAPRWWHVVVDVNRGLGEVLAAEVTTLRCLGRSEDRTLRFYEVELHGAPRDDSAWFEPDELAKIDLAEPDHRAWALRCLDERKDDGGPLRVEWARPGWFAKAVGWIRERVPDATAVVQERTWSISTVLRASTPDGDVFLKAVPRVFAGEPLLTLELGRRHPGQVPELAALDAERGWMLMRDFDGENLYGTTETRQLADAARAYAGLQVAWIDRADELLELGCPDRRLDALQTQIPLLHETELLLPGDPEGLTADEIAAVPALAERLETACERLRARDVPATLEHGDLHTDNIRRVGGEFLFFDWSDACLSVPFFSLVPFLEFHEEPLDAEVRAHLRDAYLAPWAGRLGGDLVEAFELAQFVGRFHQAVSYHRITEGTEARARWEWERGFPFFVKRLLRSDG